MEYRLQKGTVIAMSNIFQVRINSLLQMRPGSPQPSVVDLDSAPLPPSAPLAESSRNTRSNTTADTLALILQQLQELKEENRCIMVQLNEIFGSADVTSKGKSPSFSMAYGRAQSSMATGSKGLILNLSRQVTALAQEIHQMKQQMKTNCFQPQDSKLQDDREGSIVIWNSASHWPNKSQNQNPTSKEYRTRIPVPSISTLQFQHPVPVSENPVFQYSNSGYNQIKMAPEDKTKTVFTTQWGTYCYRVMPFGLKNAGATYQRAATTLLHDQIHKEVEVYADDMIIKTKNRSIHICTLEFDITYVTQKLVKGRIIELMHLLKMQS
ncbi:uncharacterized protein LOC143859662 [Tasmannia lanceolata]|uniref:uncharacterized protein LOC143859662 n=1 Tax=Tasmannia lanceolata TaxID=3420 RepID=UPI004063CB9D